MKKANGTVAKDIALYFLDLTTDRYTPSVIAKTINQAKQLLEADYTKEEIISVIDYVLDNAKTKIYSLGYINHCINDVLRNINEQKEKEIIKELIEQAKIEQASTIDDGSEVIDESKERNRQKVERTCIQSRVREKFDFNLLEE